MKCLCGNKYLEDWEIDREFDFCGTDKEKEKLKEANGEKFIVIRGNFTCVEGLSWSSRLKEVSLYVCPKCGTVKAKDFGE